MRLCALGNVAFDHYVLFFSTILFYSFRQGLVSPKKDYGSGELLIGAASVAQGTFLLIDETTLEPGQLEEQGVKNVQAIHALIGAKELVAGVLFGAFLATSAKNTSRGAVKNMIRVHHLCWM